MKLVETRMLDLAFLVYLLDSVQRLRDARSGVRSIKVVNFNLG